LSLLIIGSVAFDTIETPAGRRNRIVGGSATYAALAASFFTRPRLVSVVGQDFPSKILELFRSKNVDLEGLEIKKGKTFHWHGRYGQDPNFRETIRTELNVLKEFRPVLPKSYYDSEIIFLSNLDPDSHDFILNQLKKPRLVAMDTIRFWIETKPEALLKAIQKVDLLFVNDEECRLIAREINLVRAGKKLKSTGPKVIVVKKGEHGAMLFGQNFVFGVVAHPCEKVVDPTGAGDSFAGAFLGYLDSTGRFNQREMRKAAVYGNLVASLVIEDFGIKRLVQATELELLDRFKIYKKLVSF